GFAGMMLGACGAVRCDDAWRAAALLVRASGGKALLVVALGVLARSEDLPTIVHAAADTVSLLVAGGTLGWVALLCGLAALLRGAGSRDLRSLGGLGRLMPRSAALLCSGILIVSSVPPLVGFSVLWLVVQIVLALPDASPLETGAAVAVIALLGLAMTLEGLALFRLVALIVLGRPRRPRGAAATDPAGRALVPGYAALCAALVIGVVPGLGTRFILAAGGAARAPWLHLAGPDGASGFSPTLWVLVMFVAVVVAVWWAGVRPGQDERSLMWAQGQEPPPPWLVFGEPETQMGAASLAAVVLDRVVCQGVAVPARRARLRTVRRVHRCMLRLEHGRETVTSRGGVVFVIVLAAALAMLGWWPQ
ncbi:hypothetical protein HUK82_16645, partial [Ameyamaea chiangmaiensis]|nr:hypothetical protein [Ameyamaea chiangmaiensis]